MSTKKSSTKKSSAKKLSAKESTEKWKVTLALQGGGARGAYQGGAYQALHEAELEPDLLSAISSGSLNAAVIAGNRRASRLDRLRELWKILSVHGVPVTAPTEWKDIPAYFAAWATYFGKPGFYVMRPFPPWMMPSGTPSATSFYSNYPLAGTMARVIDYDILNARDGLRLKLGVTDVESGTLCFFDNLNMKLGPEHILATAALPPGASAVRIGHQSYWDGGVAGNSPLDGILDDLVTGDRVVVFSLELWSARGPEPRDVAEAQWRQTAIRFASRTDASILADRVAFDKVITQLMSSNEESSVFPKVHIVRVLFNTWVSPRNIDPINFTTAANEERWALGYEQMKLVLAEQRWLEDYNENECIGIWEHVYSDGKFEKSTHFPSYAYLCQT